MEKLEQNQQESNDYQQYDPFITNNLKQIKNNTQNKLNQTSMSNGPPIVCPPTTCGFKFKYWQHLSTVAINDSFR